MNRTKVNVSVSLVPGKEYFLKHTPLKEVLDQVKQAPTTAEVWVDVKGQPLIPIRGEDKIAGVKTCLRNLLQRYKISSLVQSEDEILEIISKN